jgi:hypothetical protein
MVAMPNESTNEARAELQSCYLRGLHPMLAGPAPPGAGAPLAGAALDAEVRRFLDLSRGEGKRH